MSERVFVQFQRAEGMDTEAVWINPANIWGVRPQYPRDDPNKPGGVTRLDHNDGFIHVKGSVMETLFTLSGS